MRMETTGALASKTRLRDVERLDLCKPCGLLIKTTLFTDTEGVSDFVYNDERSTNNLPYGRQTEPLLPCGSGVARIRR